MFYDTFNYIVFNIFFSFKQKHFDSFYIRYIMKNTKSASDDSSSGSNSDEKAEQKHLTSSAPYLDVPQLNSKNVLFRKGPTSADVQNILEGLSGAGGDRVQTLGVNGAVKKENVSPTDSSDNESDETLDLSQTFLFNVTPNEETKPRKRKRLSSVNGNHGEDSGDTLLLPPIKKFASSSKTNSKSNKEVTPEKTLKKSKQSKQQKSIKERMNSSQGELDTRPSTSVGVHRNRSKSISIIDSSLNESTSVSKTDEGSKNKHQNSKDESDEDSSDASTIKLSTSGNNVPLSKDKSHEDSENTSGGLNQSNKQKKQNDTSANTSSFLYTSASQKLTPKDQLQQLYPNAKLIKSRIDLNFHANCKLHLLRVPRSIDPQLLLNNKLKLHKSEFTVKLNGVKYVFETAPKKPDPCLVIAKRAKVLSFENNYIVKKYIKPSKEPEVSVDKQLSVEMPKNLKMRHPLFGCDYEDKIILDNEVKLKLDDAISNLARAQQKAAKKHSKKYKAVQEPEQEEVIFSLLKEKKVKREVSDDSAFSSGGSTATAPKKHKKHDRNVTEDINIKQELFTADEHDSTTNTYKKKKKKKSKDMELDFDVSNIKSEVPKYSCSSVATSTMIENIYRPDDEHTTFGTLVDEIHSPKKKKKKKDKSKDE